MALIAVVCFSPLFLQACDSMVSQNEPEEVPLATDPGSKIRHPELMDQAIRMQGGNKNGNPELNLIFSVEPQRILDRYKILDRFKILDRYKILDRFAFLKAFLGFAITIEDMQGEGDFDEVLELMENDPDVQWIEPDFNVNPPAPSGAAQNSGQEIPWSVSEVGGLLSWAVSGDGKGSVNVDVYVLDSGVAMANNSDPYDDLALVESIDFRDLNNQDARDYDGHGSHIAGIIGAADDADGMVGIAPGVRIHNYKVLNDNGGTDVSVSIAAVEHILEEKMDNPSKPMVVNMSLGENIGYTSYTALDQAVQAAIDAGVVFVISAGNEGAAVELTTPAHVHDAITVGSYNRDHTFSEFSNYGSIIDILAPGEGIVSIGDEDGDNRFDNGSVKMSGTSMSAAHVTGAAALYLAQHPQATPQQVRNALVANARDIATEAPSGTTTKTVWVGPDASQMQSRSLSLKISSSYDDVEQRVTDGYMYRTSSDLELGNDFSHSNPQRMIGLRFRDLGIPRGAIITNAYIQFTADETNSEPTNLMIWGEKVGNAASYSSSSYNVTNRAKTNTAALWTPAPWMQVGAAGADQRTPDLSRVVQEIVHQANWNKYNDMSFMISGTGERTAESRNGSSSKAPRLYIEWEEPVGSSSYDDDDDEDDDDDDDDDD